MFCKPLIGDYGRNRQIANQTHFLFLPMCVFSGSVISNSLQPHAPQPTRLLCLWDSSGKNTGVDSHSLLQGISLTQGSPALQADSLPSEPPRKPFFPNKIGNFLVSFAFRCGQVITLWSIKWMANKNLLHNSLSQFYHL